MIEYVSIILLGVSLLALVVGGIGVKIALANNSDANDSNDNNFNI